MYDIYVCNMCMYVCMHIHKCGCVGVLAHMLQSARGSQKPTLGVGPCLPPCLRQPLCVCHGIHCIRCPVNLEGFFCLHLHLRFMLWALLYMNSGDLNSGPHGSIA